MSEELENLHSGRPVAVNIRDLLRDTRYDYEDRFTEEGEHYVNLTLGSEITIDPASFDPDQDYVELALETDAESNNVCLLENSKLTLNQHADAFFGFQLSLQTNQYEYQGIQLERDPLQFVQVQIFNLFNSGIAVSWRHTYEAKGMKTTLTPYAGSEAPGNFDCLPIVEPSDDKVGPFIKNPPKQYVEEA